ncbi:ABC transporter permease [Neolewinella sp.]|uniref:ABC transporter permease n=1 Tax=Neolewinella sp. TaxID=2993543 RepID=UPI003B52341D
MRWAYAYLALLLVVAVLAPWLATNSESAPIPFRAETTALTGPRYAPPGTLAPDGRRHYLGTDRLGRDTAAGLVAGTRVAVLVGAGSLVLALLIGVPLGAVAGFFGDGGMHLPRAGLIALMLGALVGSAYFWGSLVGLAEGPVHWLTFWVCSVGVVAAVSWLLLRAVGRWVTSLRKPVGVPVDRLVVLLIELVSSIPGLVILIAVLSLVRVPSLWLVVLIIGLIGWTSIARFLRAELLRIRELPYIAAARITGVGEWRLLWRHALPNAVGPLVVVAAFFVGSSILAEAMLSFLGVGVPADQVTWGSMLQQSRARPEAWWLAVFPGLLLTLTVLACNRLRREG